MLNLNALKMLIVFYFKPKPVFLCTAEASQQTPQAVRVCTVCARARCTVCVCAERLVAFRVNMHATCARAPRTHSVSGCSPVCVRLCVHVTVLENDINNVPRSVQNIKQVLTCMLRF